MTADRQISIERQHVTAAAPATRAELTLTLFGGVWLLAGLFIDGYAHSEIIDTETEDFFTPWHAIFYSGFAVTVLSVAQIVRRRATNLSVLTWLPAGYGLAAVGIGVFGLGGIGDGIWHAIFGIETGVDALLSPTHLLLFAGMALLLTTPVRAAWFDPSARRGWSELGVAVVSVAITTALFVFFCAYAFGLTETWPQQLPFDASIDNDERIVGFGLATAFLATGLLAGPVLMLLRRWDLPNGAVVLVWTLPVVLEVVAFDDEPIAISAAIVGGLVFELALRAGNRVTSRRSAILFATPLAVVALWTTWMALVWRTETVRWPPELWSGQIVMSAIIAWALAIMVFPTPTPRSIHDVEPT